MYPTVFPLNEVTRVIAILRAGQYQANLAELAHAIWVITGYVFSVVFGLPPAPLNGNPPTVGDAGSAPALTAEQKDLLLELKAAFESPQVVASDPNSAPSDVLVGSMLTKFWHEVLWPMIHHLIEKIFGPIDNGPN